MFKTLQDFEPNGKKVIVRTDLNAPIKDGKIEDCLRFEVYSKTLKQLQECGAKIILLAHQGRPHRDDFTRLKQHSKVLKKYLKNVRYHDEVSSQSTKRKIEELENGEILLLENVRFLSEELENCTAAEHARAIFVKELAKLADFYVNDAFSTAHRKHASLMGFTELLDAYAGEVMRKEYETIEKIRKEIKHPLTLILGGAKPKDEIQILKVLAEKADNILLGGVIGELALITSGYNINKKEWLQSKGYMKDIKQLEDILDSYNDKIMMPIDLACEVDGVRVESTRDGCENMPYDIGSKTIKKYSEVISDSSMILLKGPMGLFEKDSFSKGSKEIVKEMANSNAYTVLGGGHTSSLVKKFNMDIDQFSHVSIAGGAFIKQLSGEKLPAIQALI